MKNIPVRERSFDYRATVMKLERMIYDVWYDARREEGHSEDEIEAMDDVWHLIVSYEIDVLHLSNIQYRIISK